MTCFTNPNRANQALVLILSPRLWSLSCHLSYCAMVIIYGEKMAHIMHLFTHSSGPSDSSGLRIKARSQNRGLARCRTRCCQSTHHIKRSECFANFMHIASLLLCLLRSSRSIASVRCFNSPSKPNRPGAQLLPGRLPFWDEQMLSERESVRP